MRIFLLGALVGYVLGTRAGRDRYEQILRTYRKLLDHPAVQGAAGIARAKIGEKTGLSPDSPKRAQEHHNGLRDAESAAYPRP